MYDPYAPPDPNNPYDPRNEPGHPENPNWPTGGGSGGGGLPAPGGGGIVLLAILYFIMILSTAAVISATIAAPVLVFLGKWFDWENPPPWSWAFTAAFFGFFAYFLVAISMIGVGSNKDLYDLPANLWTIPNLLHQLAIQTPPLLACGSVIWWRLGKEFRAFEGFRGWLRSVGAAILCLVISTTMIAATARRVADINPASVGDLEGLLGLGLISVIFAGFGALLGMIPIAIGVKTRRSTEAPARIGFWRIYFATALGLIVWFNASLWLEYCFNMLDPIYFFFDDEAVAAEILSSHSQLGYILPFALGSLCTQLAAFGFAGGAIAARLRPAFSGRAGWLAASTLGFLSVVLAGMPFVLLLTAMYLSGSAKELFQSF